MFFLFFFWFFLIIFFNVHYMMLLLVLEVLLLSVLLFISIAFLGPFGLIGVFLFLMVMVCMGGFSVSLLVSVSRFFGRDFWFFSFVF